MKYHANPDGKAEDINRAIRSILAHITKRNDDKIFQHRNKSNNVQMLKVLRKFSNVTRNNNLL